jgi:hypothetical protein
MQDSKGTHVEYNAALQTSKQKEKVHGGSPSYQLNGQRADFTKGSAQTSQ